MEGTQQTIPTGRPANSRPHNHTQPQRSGQTQATMRVATASKKGEPLNCIIDDSALLAGLKERGENNMNRWVHDSIINLFVPLYTLEKLTQLRSGPSPINLEARKALEWLDNITNVTENKSAGFVQLQGPDDQYASWHDVESYLLPDTPLSSQNGPDNLDRINEAFERNLSLRGGASGADAPADANAPKTPSTTQSKSGESSPGMTEATPAKENIKTPIAKALPNARPAGTTTNKGHKRGGTGGIPARVRPLLNFVVWRTYHQDPSIGGTGRYILLTDDPTTQKQAQKFGVRAKLLSQVNAIMARTERPPADANVEFVGVGETPPLEVNHGFEAPAAEELQEEDDEVVFNPAQRPLSWGGRSAPGLMDPDHFGRSPTAGFSSSPAAVNVPQQPGPPPSPRRSPRMPNAAVFNRGGNGSSRGGHGAANPRGQTNVAARGVPRYSFSKPIDPNSFARPGPHPRRGRGGFRKLWEPDS